jgi:hypothetical protein
MVWTESLPLPEALRARLDAWAVSAAHEWEDAAVLAEGRALLFNESASTELSHYRLTSVSGTLG